MEKIDFTIAWVDGSDKNWLKEKEKYNPDFNADNAAHRFRDWDLLKYWFRGVEEFAPWVNKIHFLTWGHVPEWLNVNNPKLNIVNHRDYIPEKYLPTFNSHTIELNMHKIPDLSEHFVYFNDDMFLISKVKETDFFKNTLPMDSAVLSVHCSCNSIIESHIPISIVSVINDHFDMRTVIRRDMKKWFNLKYSPKLLLRTMCLLPSPRFPGFWQHHLPTSFCKSTFEEVWKVEDTVLNTTCMHKFRTANDVSQWLMREWQISSGKFEPRNSSFGKSFHMDRKGVEIVKDIGYYISTQNGKVVVINDGEMNKNEYENAKSILNTSFESILPNKSTFEV